MKVASLETLYCDAGWRPWIFLKATTDDGLVGWADDSSIVLDSGRVNLDGEWIRRWDALGTTGPLSRDGTSVAGITTSSDLRREDVTLIDTREGSRHVIWSAPAVIDCGGLRAGTKTCQPGPDPTSNPSDGITAYARIAAWAPDGSAVLLLDQQPDSTSATLRVVSVDGSGAGPKATIDVPDLSGILGYPNIGPSIIWLPATAP